MLSRQLFLVESDGVIVDDPCPQPDGKAELAVGQGAQQFHFPEITGAEDIQPNLAQVVKAFPEQVQHPGGIDVDVFEPDGVFEAEDRYRLGPADGCPGIRVALHQVEGGAHHLVEHAAQVGAGVLGVMNLGAKKGLGDFESIRDRGRGHPDIDAETGDIRLPHVLGQIELCKFAGKAEIPAYGLSHTLAIERPGEWVDDAVGNRPIELVPVVERGNIVKAAVQYRLHEQLDPFGCDAPEIRIDHHTCLRIQHLGNFENASKSTPLTGYARIREGNLGDGLHPVMKEDGAKIHGSSILYNINGTVA